MRDQELQLREGVSALGLVLQEEQISMLLDYLALIQKWNKVYNLTAVRDAAEMLTHHLLDSLAVVAPLRRRLVQQGLAPKRLLDVGSGAGLPGVVLAICCPDLKVDCVDTVAKKAAFIQQVALALKLPNLRGLHARVESLQDSYVLISARAFSSLEDLARLSGAALAPGGCWMAMKGKHPDAELDAVARQGLLFHVEPLQVPGLDAARCIVWMRPPDQV